MTDTSTDTVWRSRIVDTGTEDPMQLVANPKNWRIHPQAQQRVLGDVLDRVGWVQDVIVNRGTGFVVDGHLRIQLAITREEPSVPVSYVELTEAEEDLVLAGLDPLSSLAIADPEALNNLLESDVDGELAGLFAPEERGEYEDAGNNDVAIEYTGTAGDDVIGGEPIVRGDNEYVLMCPECGHEFSVNVDD
jgi:hypothetical protein